MVSELKGPRESFESKVLSIRFKGESKRCKYNPSTRDVIWGAEGRIFSMFFRETNGKK